MVDKPTVEEVPLTPRSPGDEDHDRLLEEEDPAEIEIERLAPIEGQENLLRNLVTKHALIAQFGIIGLTVIFWGACFIAGVMLFSAHVLLNSAGLLLITQSILVLQPTHTPNQKRRGTALHFIFNAGSLSALLTGLVIIEITKFQGGRAHFVSVHSFLGGALYLFLLLQGVVGFTQYYTPMIYGSVDRAKSIWKYHRASGYFTVTLGLLVMIAATLTEYNEKALRVPLWFAIIESLLVIGGVVLGIRLKKFGLGGK